MRYTKRNKPLFSQGMKDFFSIILATLMVLNTVPTQAFAEQLQSQTIEPPAQELVLAEGELAEGEGDATPEGDAGKQDAAQQGAPAGEAAGQPGDSAKQADSAKAADSAKPDSAKKADTTKKADAKSASASDPEAKDEAKDEAEPELAEGATVHKQGDLYEVQVFGKAAESESAAASAIAEEGVGLQQARLFAAPLFASEGEDVYPDGDFPRRADGSDIETISIRWLTPDTEGHDDGSASNLYLVPSGDSPFSVRFQLDYALSGEHHYEPGDINIKIPAQIFHKRNSNTTSENDGFTGTMVIPLSQSPNTTTDFNWQLIDGEYVLTNTKTIVAATKGFVQFEIKDLVPHEIVDMSTTDDLQATIEVLTHLDNTIGLKSNKIKAQVNTTQEVVRANKDISGNLEIKSTSEVGEVPASIKAKYPDDTQFLVVTWYANAYHTGNQPYTLTGYDTRTDVATGATTTTLHDGWVIDGDSETTKDLGTVQQGWYTPGTSTSSSVMVAYPMSQFERNTVYTFTNHVDYDLVPIDEVDDPTHVEADALTTWSYRDPEWIEPVGHFNVFKWGNDNDYGVRADGNLTTHRRTSSRGDIPQTDGTNTSPQHLQGWYGLYKKALNEMREGNDVEIAYTIKSDGYVLPWTYEGDTRLESSYGKRPVTMVTEDTGLWVGSQDSAVFDLVPGENMEFTSISFVKPIISKIKAINVNPDGSFETDIIYTRTDGSASDGTFDYQPDEDDSKIPPVVLEVQRNGSWETYATADFTSGSCVITLADGSVVQGDKIDFPEGTENFRTSVTTSNAAIVYCVRPSVLLYNTQEWRDHIEGLFENNASPFEDVWNGVMLDARTYEGTDIVHIEKDGFDRLMGFTADVMAIPYKSGTVGSVDYDNKKVPLHYTARVEERSVITDIDTYVTAIEEGVIQSETHGWWYDLLPLGVTPDLDSIVLRSGDTVVDAYTIPDYKGTGRVLMVVECDLTPSPKPYVEDGVTFYEDVPSIEFDASCDTGYIIDYGQITEPDKLFEAELHNVVVFESSNDVLGTIEGYQGEANDPEGTNNVRTPEAWSEKEDEAAQEKMALAGLHDGRTTPSFLYAGDPQQVKILNAASTSLVKDVSVNNDGWWSQGTYYGNREANARDVYEGGMYSYRIFAMSNSHTQTKDMVLYDSLENYVAWSGNDQEDVDAIDAGKIWRGKLRSVDTSLLRAAGIDAVVYYSTVPELKIQEVDDPLGGHINPTTTNLDDPNYWVKASDYTGDLGDVHAVAIDCRKATDGSDYVLQPDTTVTAYIHMWAPQGEEASYFIQNDHHAYNNIFLNCTSIDTRVGGQGDTHLIRQDYVKVGLVENSVNVTKQWNDDDDRDGIRPEEITYTLLRDGEVYEPIDSEHPDQPQIENPVTVPVDSDGNADYTFKYLPYCDDEGRVFTYSVREEPVEGYTSRVVRMNDGHDVAIINRHEPEQTEVSGSKTWVGDTADVRPASIKVNLLADGELFKTQTVTPDADGFWSYSFAGLNKYRDQGVEIAYTVEEEHTLGSALDSYDVKVDGFDIVNTYHPFGDIELVKSVTGATRVTRNNTFDFDFTIADLNGVPVFDEYAYEIVDAQGKAQGSGMVTTGTTVAVGDGQTIRIKEVPQGYKVTAMENIPAGYTAFRDGIVELTVKPNQTVSATAYNTYKTEGYLNLHATKVLTGRDMKNSQFRFNLTTVEVGGDVVTAASSSLDGSVVFDALRFTNIDDGAVKTFYMHELDFGRPGYTYDASVYKVEVHVKDNGDGTMTATPTYFQRGPLGIGWVQMEEEPEFKNEYHAEGDLEVKAWKTLKKRDLKEGEFTYELVDSKGAVVATATNDATGTVAFPKIHFDETSVGAELDYTIREKAGTDKTVIYSDETYKVHVTVSDNGDGTLSFDQAVTGADGEAATPVITNDLKDGKLAVEKVVEQTDVPDSEFKFKVKFSGPDVPKDGSYSFTKEQIGQNSNKAAAASNKMLSPSNLLGQLGDGLSSAGREVAGLFAPKIAYAAASDGVFHAPASMLQGEAYAVYDSETKVFEFFRAAPGAYENAQVDGTKTYYTGIEAEDGFGPGDYIASSHWKSAIKRATTIRVAEGVAVRPIGYIDLQGTYNNTTENIDFSRIDTSRITYLKMDGSYTQDGQGYVSIVGLENLDTSNMTNIRVAGDFGKYGLLYGDLDLSNWSGQSLVSMYNMFEDQRELVSLDLSGLSTPNVTNMFQAFSSMSKLERLDISSLDTSKVVDEGYYTGMNGMFSGSSNLKEVVLGPNFNFRGAGIEDTSHWAKLPTPKKSSEYTGKWTCVEHPEYSLTSTELAEQYDGPTMYGTWVWEKYEFLISYAAEEDGSNIYSTSPKIPRDSLADYELPNYSYNDRAIAGWKLVYPDGTESDTDDFKGYRDLGAQAVGKTFGEIIANGKSLDKALVDKGQIHVTFAPVFLTNYQVDFLPGEGAGSMASLTERPITEDTVIPASTFYAFNKQVGSWVDDLGNVYPAEGTIPANTVNRPVVTLTAQWIPVDNKIDMKDGEFEFTLRGNERAIFDTIPAGTAYQVWEETPAGWVLVKSVNTAGKIEPLETSTATFTNEYNPNAASAQLTASKLLDGQPAPEAGKFSFTLTGAGQNQTKTNAAGGGITFDPIIYTSAGTYTYTIAEVAGDDSSIIYTGATYTATVTVEDDGAGKLTATVAYADVDGNATTLPTFRNESKTGSLTLQKKVTGTGAPADAEFTFVVTLSAAGDFPYRTESGAEGRIRNGGTITLKGNDRAHISGLPFGTTYSVAETSIPEDFTLTEEFNSSGTISADYTLATFTNTYEGPLGSAAVNLQVRKVLENGTLAAGQFDFQLIDSGGNVIDSASNDASGRVVFGAIEYKEAGTYTYTVHELVPETSDDTITYDTVDKTITVTVEPDPADATKLVATPSSYNPDDESSIPTFTNKQKTGDLLIAKASNAKSAAALDRDFSFVVTLEDAEGNPLEGTYDYFVGSSADDYVEGTITSGGTIEMKAGYVAMIFDLPLGTHYRVVEQEATGFQLARSVSDEGEITLSSLLNYAVFVNEYSAYGELRLEAQKILEGRALINGQFTFELTDEAGNVISYATNDAEGFVKFPPLAYTAEDDAKTYTYTIREVDSQDQGYTFDPTVLTVTVKVTDNGDGTLTLEKAYEGDSDTFKNVYHAEGSVELEASKSLVGRKLAEGQFSFELVDVATGQVLDTAPNDAEGKVAFKAIPYTEADMVDEAGNHVTTKDFAYAIREVVPNPVPAGYTYDDHVEDVTVTVTDNGDGVLRTTAAYDEDGAAFENVYKAEGSVELEARKTLSGRALAEGQFSFELCDEAGTVLQTVANGATGKVAFGPIAYTEADAGKSFTYTIKEVVPEEVPAGYAYDADEKTVTVDVVDNGDGTLTVTPSYQGGSATFENAYEAKGEVVLEGTKELTGRVIEDGQFSFEVVDAEGEVVSTGTNDAEGKVTFEPIAYTQDDMVDEAGNPVAEKTFTYDVYEVDDEKPGYTYDEHLETVSVKVADNGDGTLTATPTYDADGTAFANVYEATGEAVIEAEKVLEGRKLAEGQFEFELIDAETGEVLETVANDADGKVAFSAIAFNQDQLGPHDYIIREVVPEELPAGYTYSNQEFGATITVSDNGDGTLDCAVSYVELPPAEEPAEEDVPTEGDVPVEGEVPAEEPAPEPEPTPEPEPEPAPEPTPVDAAVFVNVYEASGEAEVKLEKRLTGATLKAGQFSFELRGPDGKLIETVTNDASGKIVFAPLAYTQDDAGSTYEYSITEVDGKQANFTYDKHAEKVAVKVIDNGDGTLTCEVSYLGKGRFENSYTEPKRVIPRTGDATDYALPIAIGAGGAGVLLVGLFARRRKDD